MECANINKASITNHLGFVWLGHNFDIENIQRIKLLTGRSNLCMFSADSYCLFNWCCHNTVVSCDLLLCSPRITSVRANQKADFISEFTDIKRGQRTE